MSTGSIIGGSEYISSVDTGGIFHAGFSCKTQPATVATVFSDGPDVSEVGSLGNKTAPVQPPRPTMTAGGFHRLLEAPLTLTASLPAQISWREYHPPLSTSSGKRSKSICFGGTSR